MTSQLQFDNLIRELSTCHKTVVTLHGWRLLIEHSSQDGLLISTQVYQGDRFVPLGVREAIQTNFLTDHSFLLNTYVRLDDRTFSVMLYYSGGTKYLNTQFSDLLEDFCWAAERWWHYLNEKDRRDLVPVYVK